MDNLDIKIVDSLTVNLNQEEYSTEGQVLNTIDVYVEDELLLFEAALTQDSINIYTRETPDIISFDTKEIVDGISKLESLILKTSKEATLLAKVAELKEALNTIDFTAIEQSIQNVKDVTAKEATLIQEINTVSKKIDDIYIPELDKSDIAKEQSLNNGINTLSNKIDNIDLSIVAKESTIIKESQSIKDKIDNIDFTPIENKVDESVNTLSTKIDNIDLSSIAKQGENKEATNSKIYEAVKNIPDLSLLYAARAEKNDDGVNTYSIVLPVTAKVTYDNNGVATIQL